MRETPLFLSQTGPGRGQRKPMRRELVDSNARALWEQFRAVELARSVKGINLRAGEDWKLAQSTGARGEMSETMAAHVIGAAGGIV